MCEPVKGAIAALKTAAILSVSSLSGFEHPIDFWGKLKTHSFQAAGKLGWEADILVALVYGFDFERKRAL